MQLKMLKMLLLATLITCICTLVQLLTAFSSSHYYLAFNFTTPCRRMSDEEPSFEWEEAEEAVQKVTTDESYSHVCK